MFKKIALVLLLSLIGGSLFFIFSLSKKDKQDDLNKSYISYYKPFDNKHLWKPIINTLNIDNYNRVWINPDNYDTFEDFLTDFSEFKWIKINPVDEKFSIAVKGQSWKKVYVPFDFKKNKEIFNDKTNKNLAILDVYSAYKNGLIYWWIDSHDADIKILYEEDFSHKLTWELRKIFGWSVNVFDYVNSLEKTNSIWKENTELLSYLYDFTWKYEDANSLRKKVCDNCDKEIDIEIFWKVLDWKGNPLSWVKVELLNNSKNVLSDKDWVFRIKSKHFSFSHLRFKASINWYSDWFNTHSLNSYFSPNSSKKISLNFKLNKSDKAITINKNNYKDYLKGKYYLVETDLSKYYIPKDWLFLEDWNKYILDEFKIYLYHFKKSSNMENLLENDTFEPVYWYVWNIMKTFWMPYIQIIDSKTGKELYTKSSDPMILQNQIYHMKELYEDYDWLYWAITDEDMKFLVESSKNSEKPYPIDFEFLTKNEFLRWPAWWVLDRKTWIWSNIWHRVLNMDGLVELPFFHIKVD